jgi:fructose/tagatose bisphosphate aldolase
MNYRTVAEMRAALAKDVRFVSGTLEVIDPAAFREQQLDRLVHSAVFGSDEVRAAGRWVIWEAAQSMGALPASIQGLYEAAGKGKLKGRTVPALNLRGMAYDMARAAVRAALSERVGALIFELSRGEMDFTSQSPAEYAAVVLAAAIREGFSDPIFIQGDHFQISQKAYDKDPDAEVRALQGLVGEALEAGFYNIDIDASTLVDLGKADLAAQQALNVKYTAEFTSYIRAREPRGITVSIGGEIGEVGGHNSTLEELHTYVRGYRRLLPAGTKGISKISVQTGTVHGGVPLPDGSVADVKLDFERLKELSRVAREEYGMAGAVQHGASTLPDEAFDRFPEADTAEVHLATGFQNIVFASPAFPAELMQRVHAHLDKHLAAERKPGETDEQFHYSTRKKAWGPMKRQFWDLPAPVREQIGHELEEQFRKLYRKLGVADSVELVAATVRPVPIHKPAPSGL